MGQAYEKNTQKLKKEVLFGGRNERFVGSVVKKHPYLPNFPHWFVNSFHVLIRKSASARIIGSVAWHLHRFLWLLSPQFMPGNALLGKQGE